MRQITRVRRFKRLCLDLCIDGSKFWEDGSVTITNKTNIDQKEWLDKCLQIIESYKFKSSVNEDASIVILP